jgi:rRNA maturation RNase YbeY
MTWLMSRARKLDRQTAWGDISVNLTGDSQIAEVKERVFGRDEVTDIIALRYDPIPGIEELATAELFVNVERAAGVTRGTWSTSKELALYLAHGCDHLAGQSDNTETERNRMRRRELRWLREAEALGLIDGLV